MKEYVATKQWRDGFGANETRITAADLIRIEDGISSATRGVTSLETVVQGQPAKVLEEVKKIAQTIRTELAKAIPVGTIAMFGADRDPEGWLRCDGRVLQRSAYPALFAALGTTYGSTNSGRQGRKHAPHAEHLSDSGPHPRDRGVLGPVKEVPGPHVQSGHRYRHVRLHLPDLYGHLLKREVPDRGVHRGVAAHRPS